MYTKQNWNSYDEGLTLEENVQKHAVATKDYMNHIEEGIYDASKPLAIGTVTEGAASAEIVDAGDSKKLNLTIPKGENGKDGINGEKGDTGADGKDGADGKSAYELAVKNGYTGTEAEWLASLKGKDGANGKDGVDGADGVDGKSAYEIAVAGGYTGTQVEWVASLKGEKGADGKDMSVSNTYPTMDDMIADIDNLATNDFVMIVNPDDPDNNGKIYVKAEDGTLKPFDKFEGLTIQGEKGDPGVDGKSAYQIATENGFSGTMNEWLASLKGKDGTNGADGKSAYEVAVAGGYTGTEAEWLASLKGKDGAPGEKGADGSNGKDGTNGVDGKDGAPGEKGADGKDGTNGIDGKDGVDGKSAYEVAVKNGYTGTEAEWLVTLKGEKGDAGVDGKDGTPGEKGTDGVNGKDGTNGIDGKDGVDGKSAYELAVDGGYTGTLEEWLNSLKGKDGANGKDGTPGEKGADGTNGADGKDGANGTDGTRWHTSDTPITDGAAVPENTPIVDLFLDSNGDVFEVTADNKYKKTINIKGIKGDAGSGGSGSFDLKIGNITSGDTPAAALRVVEGVTYLDITFPKVPALPVIWQGDIILKTADWKAATGNTYTQEIAIDSVTVDNTVDVTDGSSMTQEMIDEMNICGVTPIEQKAGALVFKADALPELDIQLHIKTTTDPVA